MEHFMKAFAIKLETADDDAREILQPIYDIYDELGNEKCHNTLCQDKLEHTIRDCARYYEIIFDIAYKKGGPLYHMIEHIYQFLNYELEVEYIDWWNTRDSMTRI